MIPIGHINENWGGNRHSTLGNLPQLLEESDTLLKKLRVKNLKLSPNIAQLVLLPAPKGSRGTVYMLILD